jgi:hypothetical protein
MLSNYCLWSVQELAVVCDVHIQDASVQHARAWLKERVCNLSGAFGMVILSGRKVGSSAAYAASVLSFPHA